MHFVGRWRRVLRRNVWEQVGFVTSVLALGRWPDWFNDIIVALHEKAYYKWADARGFVPRCFTCTQPIDHTLTEESDTAAIFCSKECRTKFDEHVRKHRRDMPPSLTGRPS
jgi:hypothetical protein